MILRGSDHTVTAGTMGGDTQPQILANMIPWLSWGQSPEQAVSEPRVNAYTDPWKGFNLWSAPNPVDRASTVAYEAGTAPGVVRGMEALGHTMVPCRPNGHAQVAIRRHADGSVDGAADARAASNRSAESRYTTNRAAEPVRQPDRAGPIVPPYRPIASVPPRQTAPADVNPAAQGLSPTAHVGRNRGRPAPGSAAPAAEPASRQLAPSSGLHLHKETALGK